MINVSKRLIVISLFFSLPFTTSAWGLLGHRIVGEIAEKYLTPAAKSEVIKILGPESMAMASNWADFIKSDSTMSYLSEWHYVDMKRGLSHAQVISFLKNDTATDAYTKLNFLIKELKNKKLPFEKKQMYLRLLIHIVGDIHQPLHVGNPEDKGGNDIRVTWFGATTNLHSVWDSRLIDFQQLSYTEYTAAINHPTKVQSLAWQKQPLAEWIYQTYQEADKVYADIKPDDRLGYLYNYKFLEVLNRQLLIGGVHLAAILNEIFAKK